MRIFVTRPPAREPGFARLPLPPKKNHKQHHDALSVVLNRQADAVDEAIDGVRRHLSFFYPVRRVIISGGGIGEIRSADVVPGIQRSVAVV
jgi:hypothetical protein